ncbi:MAG: YlbF family regulator [Desulfotomaculum sp.]|nr:YlbF family regulator [Desulfotomaculum sp.]
MSKQILEKALELGKHIAESEEFASVQEKEAAMLQDPDAKKLLMEYQELQQKYQQKQMQGEKITPEDIKIFESKEIEMLDNENIKKFHEAKDKFQDLLNLVNETINKAMLEKRNSAAQSDCSSSGCGCGCQC